MYIEMERSKRNYYIISPRVTIKAIIIMYMYICIYTYICDIYMVRDSFLDFRC